MADTPIKVKIKGEDQLTPEVKKISKTLEDLSKNNLTKVAVSFDAITMAMEKVVGYMGKVYNSCAKLVTEFSTVDRYNNRLKATWDNVGKATGVTADGVLKLADSLEKVTFFEAESIQTAAQTLAATQALNKEGFEKALSLSVDLAEAMGTDVPNAASVLSRALIAPQEGLGRLKTIGVAFTEQEKDLIIRLQEEGKTWESQQMILDKVAEKYEGIAKAVADTDTNKLTQINNTLGTIRENLGQSLLDVISPALDRLYKRLQDIEEWSTRSATNTSVFKALKSGGSLSGYSDDALAYAKNFIEMQPDWGENSKLDKQWGTLDAEQKARALKNARSQAAQNMGYVVNSNVPDVVKTVESLSESDDYAGAGLGISEESMNALLDKYNDFQDKLKEKAIQTAQMVASQTQNLMGAITDLITSSLEQQASALEKEMEAMKESGNLTIEEEKKKQDEINDLRRKAFEAEKANSVANALISTAEAIIGFMSNPGGTAGVALSALAGTTGALQVAAIQQQQYTPMATGGIVTSPTHALVGEAGPEAIIPLTQGRNPLSEMAGCTINITVEGNADEDVIFNAIERAQRTGYLPAWRYAN